MSENNTTRVRATVVVDFPHYMVLPSKEPKITAEAMAQSLLVDILSRGLYDTSCVAVDILKVKPNEPS